MNPAVIVALMFLCIAFGMVLVPILQYLDKHFASHPESGLVISPVIGPTHTIYELLDALEQQESRGDELAVGQDGELGAYQLTKRYVDDVIRILAADNSELRQFTYTNLFTYENRLDKEKSRVMTQIYISHYSYYVGVLNSSRRIEYMARVHNGGPDGWRDDPQWFVRNRNYTLERAKQKIANTKAYWLEVKARMEAVQ